MWLLCYPYLNQSKSIWDIASRITALTATPVTLSLPLIFPLVLSLILHNENRQIAFRGMCWHGTVDVSADNAGRKREWDNEIKQA